MDFHIKISGNDVVDSSSRNILVQILLKICESDVVAAIGSFQFWLDNIELRSPSIHGDYYIHYEGIQKRFELKLGLNAKNDKLEGIYVEKREETMKRLNKPVSSPSNIEIEAVYFIEPGLTGIRKCVNYVNSILKEERDELPSYLKEFDLKHFDFIINVVWDMNKEKRLTKDGIIQFIDYEQDYLSGSCDRSGCWFNYGNRLEEDFYIYNKPYFIDRLNKIQKILDDITPDSDEPRGEGEYPKILKHGMLNRKGREYYTIDDKSYEEALQSYFQEIRDQARKYHDRILDKLEKTWVEYEGRESEEEARSKQVKERVQALKNNITDLVDNIDEPKKSGENEDNSD